MKKSRFLATATVLAILATPAVAAADELIDVQDRCDPTTFNAALGDGACAPLPGGRGGQVTFDELIGSLITDQENGAWRFKDDDVKLRRGQSLKVVMSRGGEGHTVTEVSSFGLGCVPELNALVFPGQDPTAFPEVCNDPATFTPGIFGGDLIAPGLDYEKTGLSKGVHRYQCMIHPWMTSKVTVR
ncbi:MAG TPA: hypothetical protein VMY78_10585 [Solirubrobacteraceae bacterium]|nr:hypothetical protein [Solirubrobacteraceae bacterium]